MVVIYIPTRGALSKCVCGEDQSAGIEKKLRPYWFSFYFYIPKILGMKINLNADVFMGNSPYLKSLHYSRSKAVLIPEMHPVQYEINNPLRQPNKARWLNI